jgi:ribonuclease P protein component
MMEQDLRLRKHADFQRVYKQSRKHFSRQMGYFYALREESAAPSAYSSTYVGPRIGLTVGKVMGKAVDRNRIKRRLRAAIVQHTHLLADYSVDVILHPRRTALTLEWTLLERDVATAFSTIAKGLRTAQRAPDKNSKEQPPV